MTDLFETFCFKQVVAPMKDTTGAHVFAECSALGAGQTAGAFGDDADRPGRIVCLCGHHRGRARPKLSGSVRRNALCLSQAPPTCPRHGHAAQGRSSHCRHRRRYRLSAGASVCCLQAPVRTFAALVLESPILPRSISDEITESASPQGRLPGNDADLDLGGVADLVLTRIHLGGECREAVPVRFDAADR